MTEATEIVVLALDGWDEVWRRNQALVDAVIARRPSARVLYVEPSIAAWRNWRRGRPPHAISFTPPELGTVTVLRPAEWRPDRFSPYIPPLSVGAIIKEVRRLEFRNPVLWVNNHALARFALGTEWPVMYDVTDDWLLCKVSRAKLRRAAADDHTLLAKADAVSVCSAALAETRGKQRDVVLIPNGVDVERYRAAADRPAQLPSAPVALYVGTVHDERVDVALACRIARELPDVTFAYLGPDLLSAVSRETMLRQTNIKILGPTEYQRVPAFMQHADAVIVPHLVTPFTESLDPIKARECLAVGTPTVATPVAGFRGLGPPIRIAGADRFAAAVREALSDTTRPEPPPDLFTWSEAGEAFLGLLDAVASR